MKQSNKSYSWLTHLFCAAVLSALGCDSKTVVPITPRFLLDGEPLKEASISFVRSGGEQGRASFGITDDQGVAQMTTFTPLDGVMPGNYSVVVIKAPENAMTFEEPDPNDVETMVKMSSMSFAKVPQRGKERVRSTIPEIYSDPGTTPLKCEVLPGQLEYQFDLSMKAE